MLRKTSLAFIAILILFALVSSASAFGEVGVYDNAASLVIDGSAIVLLSPALEVNDAAGVMLWQDDPEPIPVFVVEEEGVEAQDIFDDAGAWARSTRDTAILLSVSVMATVSTIKTFVWAFVPDDLEERLKEGTILGFNPYSVVLLGIVMVVSWVMVATEFNWNPWLNSPIPGIVGFDESIHNLMTATLITVVAAIEHEIVTGIGPFLAAFGKWLKELVDA